MLRKVVCGVVSIVFVAALLSSAVLNAQQATAAPVPPQISMAKKAFISNTSADGHAAGYFWKIGGPTRPHEEFYAAMKNWGRYELVNSPADADLVFEMRFGEPVGVIGAPCIVSILDAKTHFTLWTHVEVMEGAIRKGTWEKNFTKGLENVIEDLKKLASQPAGGTESPAK